MGKTIGNGKPAISVSNSYVSSYSLGLGSSRGFGFSNIINLILILRLI